VHRVRKLQIGGVVALALLGLIPSSGCSLLYDLSTTQCKVTEDCQSRGGQFATATCDSGICVTPSASGGQNGSGGGGGEGGAPAECTSNEQCFDKSLGSPALCRAGKCVELLKGVDCPLVIGAGADNENLLEADPIVIGAYSLVNPISPRQSVPTLNYELAIQEFNERTLGGLPGGEGGKLRPIVAVVCAGTDSPDLEASATHLIDSLHVPAVLASIYSQDLLKTFLAHGKPNGVFFVSPLSSDSTLETANDDGLLWQMLGSASDVAPILEPLSSKVEKHVRATHGLDEAESVRVALIEAKDPFLSDLADFAYESVQWNGKSAKANESAGQFLRIRVDSANVVEKPDVSDAFAALSEFKPHIVLALASGEVVGLLTTLEANWPVASPPPFYVFSPDLFGRKDLTQFVETFAAGRSLGFNYAAAEDTRIYDSYFSRLTSEYSVDFPLEGGENFYDATYFLLYSLAAAHQSGELTGRRAAQGMRRLITGTKSFDVGPKEVGSVLNYLSQGEEATFSLMGTMGPPDFHVDTGARRMDPSIYCVDPGGVYIQNAALYDRDSNSLVGTPSCVEGFPE
jgi:hypothetical protein